MLLYLVVDLRLLFANFSEHSLIIGQLKEVTKSVSVLLIRTSPASFQRHLSSFFYVHFSLFLLCIYILLLNTVFAFVKYSAK